MTIKIMTVVFFLNNNDIKPKPENLALIEATSFFWCCYCEERGNNNTKKRYSRKQENRFIKRTVFGFK